jgi:hypothetical protein
MNDLGAWDVFAPMSGFGPRPHWPQWQFGRKAEGPKLAVSCPSAFGGAVRKADLRRLI